MLGRFHGLTLRKSIVNEITLHPAKLFFDVEMNQTFTDQNLRSTAASVISA